MCLARFLRRCHGALNVVIYINYEHCLQLVITSLFLGRLVMETFASKFGLTYSNVRARIISSRRNRKERQNKTVKQLGLD